MCQPQGQTKHGHSEKGRETQNSEQAIEAVRAALKRLRFGTIGLTVHEGRVVQVEVAEKIRL